MKWIKLVVAFLAAALLFYALHFPQGLIPPAGKFFDPFAGFWQNNTLDDELPSIIGSTALKDSVTVYWDDRRVPHVFAGNEHDLYFAQGYLTARDRLWQMEFQIMAASGRLAEIVGDQALEHDISRRRLGMLHAAEMKLDEALNHEPSRVSLEAFAEGVNAYIAALGYKDLPFEYKLLDYEPEPWTPLKSILLIQYMGWGLTSYGVDDLSLTRVRSVFADSTINKMFPVFPPFTEPIVGSRSWPPAPAAPKAPDSLYWWSAPQVDKLEPGAPALGSNNWAVAPEKTAAGKAILCNDPHLGLNLPSVWYEIQLSSPDVNVYGVTMPGAPGVIIGFNEKIAWGLTNAETDVIDWYDIEFRDSTCAEYFHNGEWRQTIPRVEKVRVRGGRTVADTTFYTHHGPVVYRKWEKPYGEKIPAGCAMSWTAHARSNELRTFYDLNRADNYEDYRRALSHFHCPGQNFAFASAEGDIAIVHQGLFPIRWEGQGRYIGDGRDPAYDWKQFIPSDLLPAEKNPDRGFVVSANQAPAGPDYPYYLSGNYAPHDRSSRINELLRTADSITPGDMITLQQDVLNVHARQVLPALLEKVNREQLTFEEESALDEMASWDYQQGAAAIAPSIFEYWWHELTDLTWDDDMQAPDGALRFPRRDVTVSLILEEPESRFFDIVTSPAKESLARIVTASFQAAVSELTGEFGALGPDWQWGDVRKTNIGHLAGIPGLGEPYLATDGRAGTINATTATHGPSWRMVVELGDTVRAWGIYPGGQSGNPGSVYYDHAVDDWVEGKIYRLQFLKSPQDSLAQSMHRASFRRQP